MFLQKTCLQVILAGKWLLRHSSTWRKQQRRPLPSLLCDSYSMGCIVRGWHHHIYIRSEAPLTWCVYADMTLYICAVRHPWRGACTLTWPYTYAQWGAPDVVRACWHDLIHMRSEAPLTWCVHADRTGCVCNMCLNNFTVIIPCPGCVSVAYCSTACRQKVRPM